MGPWCCIRKVTIVSTNLANADMWFNEWQTHKSRPKEETKKFEEKVKHLLFLYILNTESGDHRPYGQKNYVDMKIFDSIFIFEDDLNSINYIVFLKKKLTVIVFNNWTQRPNTHKELI